MAGSGPDRGAGAPPGDPRRRRRRRAGADLLARRGGETSARAPSEPPAGPSRSWPCTRTGWPRCACCASTRPRRGSIPSSRPSAPPSAWRCCSTASTSCRCAATRSAATPAGLLARLVGGSTRSRRRASAPERFRAWAEELRRGGSRRRPSATPPSASASSPSSTRCTTRCCARPGRSTAASAVLELTRLLGERPALAAAIAERFPHLIVDELEDACPAERALIARLAEGRADGRARLRRRPGPRPLRRRGAAWARRRSRSSAEVTLEPSWRYGGDVLDAAPRRARAERGERQPDGGPPRGGPARPRSRFWRCANERAEAQAVAREIESRCWPPGEVADRTASASRSRRRRARARRSPRRWRSAGSPTALAGGGAFFQRPEVRDVIAWLRLLADPTDAAAAVRALSRPPVELRSVDLARCTTIARRRKLDMVSALEASLESPQIPPEARDRIRALPGPATAAAARAMGELRDGRLRAPPDRAGRLPPPAAVRRPPRGRRAAAQPLAPRRARRGLGAPRARRLKPRLRPLPGRRLRGGGLARGRARRPGAPRRSG